MYTVYVLHSTAHHKIYIGYTSNLIQRFYSHNNLGKDWTKNYRPWTVIYVCSFETKKDALLYEKKLKGAKARQWIWENILHPSFKGFISA